MFGVNVYAPPSAIACADDGKDWLGGVGREQVRASGAAQRWHGDALPTDGLSTRSFLWPAVTRAARAAHGMATLADTLQAAPCPAYACATRPNFVGDVFEGEEGDQTIRRRIVAIGKPGSPARASYCACIVPDIHGQDDASRGRSSCRG
jgi:hypothetical protein